MNKIFLLTDYRNQFYSSTRQSGAGVNLERLRSNFAKLNFELIIISFSKINFRTQNYKNEWVLYQSSEDPNLLYRSYIEDIIFGLFMQGAKLIPSIYQFKAHHNKHFMEILRDVSTMAEIKNIQSERYGTYEDYLKDIEKFKSDQYVIKSSDKSKSEGVFLVTNLNEKLLFPKIISRTFSLKNLQYFIEKLKTRNNPLYISNHRKKFIIQTYISNLNGDYRVVVYGNKFYVLYRKNRNNDFRASGSMKFNFNIKLPSNLLNFAKKVFENFDTPYIALDIGVKNDKFFLFEFQFLSFGQYTLEKSKFYYKFENVNWNKIFEKPDLEKEIATSVVMFINNGNKEY